MQYSNIKNWLDVMRVTEKKKPLPILSFPAVQMLYVTVRDLCTNSSNQALGMKMIADRYDMPIALGYMDLSVEAEAFGAHAVYSVDEIPTITGQLISTPEQAEELAIPEVGAERTIVNIKGIRKAKKVITDRPVFAECTGPFSLAGRLMDVNEALVNCYDEPEMVHTLLKKATTFLIDYIKAFKEAGADGVIMGEPLAGILSPQLAKEFAYDYVKQIVDETQDENFAIFLHNCGNGTVFQTEDIFATGCMGYHFGDAIKMTDILEKAPKDVLILGNVSPSKEFRHGTPTSVRWATARLLEECKAYPNFWVSSGCDVPPLTEFENIDAFFQGAEDFYYKNELLQLINRP